ncbi:hypothetical protein [Halomonas sp. AOP43-D1-4]|uniref:hypothetical protein n=1 Tax=Halomonas sp. AOP43-D1-4 TaxID=3457658 RepID=UPI004034031E
MKTGSLYSVNDKALYDALHQSQLTKSDLKDLFLARGIVIPSDASREDLSKYFSRLIHDYYDYKALAKILGSRGRRDKSTVSYIDVPGIGVEQVQEAALELNDMIGDLDANSQVKIIGNKVEVVVNYREVNFNKNEFRQVDEREAVLSLEVEGDKLVIRSPLTDVVESFKGILVSNLSESLGKELEIESINMEGIQEPEKRTEFFERLIKGLDGLNFRDVTDVYIFHPKNLEDNLDDEDGEEDESDSVDLGVHITRASLKGEKVLQSEELRGLYEKGFYIWKIIWQSDDGSYDSDIFEFEAQFKDAENFTGFSYLPRGYYKYKGNLEYNSSKTGFSSMEERELSVKIEKAAQKAVADIFDDLADQPGGEDDQGENS